MTQQETLLLNQFSTGPLPFLNSTEKEEVPERETTVLDVVRVLLQYRRMIVKIAVVTTTVGLGGILIQAPTYVSESVIMPPQQSQSSMAALASGALGGLSSGMSSQLGLKNPADLYVGILKSRTIADEMIAKFDLQKVYKKRLASDTRKTLKAAASFSSSKESLISITVRDQNAKLAAALANGFVDALYKENSRLALTGSSQKRLFFEEQLRKEKNALADAEVALKSTQLRTGLLVPTGQAEVLLRSGAQLRAEISSREVQLGAARGYATDENAQVKTLKREIAALRSELAQVEASETGASRLEVSGARLPQASLEYVRVVRELKYHETLYELIAKQYEAARLDESKDAPLIQVVDRAVIADRPSRPSRLLLLLGCLIGGLLIGCMSVAALEALKKLRASLRSSAPLSA